VREIVAAYRGVLDRRLLVERGLTAADVDWLHQECLTTAMVVLRRRGRAPSPRVVAALAPVLRRGTLARLGELDTDGR
jgi:hypothetical protein